MVSEYVENKTKNKLLKTVLRMQGKQDILRMKLVNFALNAG